MANGESNVVPITKKRDENWHSNFDIIEKRVLGVMPCNVEDLDAAVFALSAVQIRCIKLINKKLQNRDLTTVEAADLLLAAIELLRDVEAQTERESNDNQETSKEV